MKLRLNKEDFRNYDFVLCPIAGKLEHLTGDDYFSEASENKCFLTRTKAGTDTVFKVEPAHAAAELNLEAWDLHSEAEDAPYNDLDENTIDYHDVWNRMYDKYHDDVAMKLFLKYGHIEWELSEV